MGFAGSIRRHLLVDVRRFVERARTIRGVRRIALIGSLTTGKRDPKHADVLIWIDDRADLAPLAAAGRQLKGRAQSHNSGADVFLADSNGKYLAHLSLARRPARHPRGVHREPLRRQTSFMR